MATDYLHLFAMSNNFQIYRNRYYGTYNAYNVCMAMEGNNIVYYFNTQISEFASFDQIINTNGKEYGVLLYHTTPPIVSVVVRNDNIKSVLDFLSGLLHLCKATTSEICAFCGEELKNPTYFEVDEVICVGHEKCCDHFIYLVNKKNIDRKEREVRPTKACGLPLLYSFVMAIVIVVTYMITQSTGLFYFILGSFIMGFLAETGYVQQKGKSGLLGYLIPLLICTLFIFIAQACMQAYLITADYSFFVGLKVFFLSWLNVNALIELLLPQLLGSIFVALLGIFIVDCNRINFILKNTVKIKKIK